jgi:hypothetical protein
MLRNLHLPDKLRASLLKSGITGEISAHGSTTNITAINRMLKNDPYVTFGIDVVKDAVVAKQFTQGQMIEVMADALGTPSARFRKDGPGYIDPQLTASRLSEMIDQVTTAARKHSVFLVATAHPGSLTSYYFKLIDYIISNGGRVYRAPHLVKVADYRWIDQIGGVHILSDQGGLLHTHDAIGFSKFLAQLDTLPDIVLADHGYAGAAMNAHIRTIAIHDVDDPGIPLAAHLGEDVLTIPMNDNQLNMPTASALQAILDSRLAP